MTPEEAVQLHAELTEKLQQLQALMPPPPPPVTVPVSSLEVGDMVDGHVIGGITTGDDGTVNVRYIGQDLTFHVGGQLGGNEIRGITAGSDSVTFEMWAGRSKFQADDVVLEHMVLRKP